MRKLRKLSVLALFLLYIAGIAVGTAREVRLSDEAEMYEYLENGINNYDTATVNGIKSALADNLKFLALLAVGSFFKPLFLLVGISILAKGYLIGFSLMATLRLYGVKGILLCGSNLLSAAILIPSAIYYGGINISGLFAGGERAEYYKRIFWATVFLAAIFCADAIIKGTLSPIFIKWAASHFKTA